MLYISAESSLSYQREMSTAVLLALLALAYIFCERSAGLLEVMYSVRSMLLRRLLYDNIAKNSRETSFQRKNNSTMLRNLPT